MGSRRILLAVVEQDVEAAGQIAFAIYFRWVEVIDAGLRAVLERKLGRGEDGLVDMLQYLFGWRGGD